LGVVVDEYHSAHPFERVSLLDGDKLSFRFAGPFRQGLAYICPNYSERIPPGTASSKRDSERVAVVNVLTNLLENGELHLDYV
jgi:hypothetical protein